MRTVHRFQHKLLAFLRSGNHLETVFSVLLEMSGSFIQIHISDVRGNHLLITVLLLHFPQESLQAVAQHRPLRQPQWQTGTYRLGKREQFHFLANLPVVPLFSLFHQNQPFIQHLLFRESNPVYPGQHLIVFVSPPVSTGQTGKFDGLNIGSVR